jgi:hypothetical protein
MSLTNTFISLFLRRNFKIWNRVPRKIVTLKKLELQKKYLNLRPTTLINYVINKYFYIAVFEAQFQ